MIPNITPQQITAGYAEMAARYVDDGWTPYLLTFMFRQLSGSPASVAGQMEREVERVYSRFVTRVVRNPKSAFEVGRLPVWICSPDYPVFKHAKKSLHDVSVNGGRHMHAIGLQPRRSRLKTDLSDHFEAYEQRDLYVRPEFPLVHVDVQAITHDLDNVVDYAVKAMLRGRVETSDVFVLPRSRTEMPA